MIKQEKLTELAATRAQLEKEVGKVEAQMRILLKQVELPNLAPETSWVESRRLSLHNHHCTAAAVESSIWLVRTSLARLEIDPEGLVSVFPGPLGRVSVEWCIEERKVSWIVGASELPWPGVQVSALYCHGFGPARVREYLTHHTAFDAVDRLVSFWQSE